MFDLIDFDFCLSDDALWAKIHLIYFGICTFYIEEKVIKLYIFIKSEKTKFSLG